MKKVIRVDQSSRTCQNLCFSQGCRSHQGATSVGGNPKLSFLHHIQSQSLPLLLHNGDGDNDQPLLQTDMALSVNTSASVSYTGNITGKP